MARQQFGHGMVLVSTLISGLWAAEALGAGCMHGGMPGHHPMIGYGKAYGMPPHGHGESYGMHQGEKGKETNPHHGMSVYTHPGYGGYSRGPMMGTPEHGRDHGYRHGRYMDPRHGYKQRTMHSAGYGRGPMMAPHGYSMGGHPMMGYPMMGAPMGGYGMAPQPGMQQPTANETQEQAKAAEAAADTAKVGISGMQFQPTTLRVTAGTKVHWENNDSMPHSIDGSGISSGIFQRGQGFAQTFSKPGTYEYSCGLHPSMRGTVIVEPAASAQDSTARDERLAANTGET